MKAYKQAAIAVVLLASVTTEVNGFNLPTSHRLEPAIKQQRQLVRGSSSIPKLDVKSIKSSGKLFLIYAIQCMCVVIV